MEFFGRNSPSASGTYRKLNVQIVEGRDLLALEKLGSDTYAEACLVGVSGDLIKDEGTRRTNTVSKTTAPNWSKAFTFGDKFELAGNILPTLRVKLFDEERFGAGRPMGQVDVPLDNLPEDGTEVDQWYAVAPFGNIKPGTKLGELRLKVQLEPSDKAAHHKRASGGSAMAVGGPGSGASYDENYLEGEVPGSEDEDYKLDAPNVLKVVVKQARELQAADMSLMGPGTSDPLVILKLGKQEVKTAVKKRTLTPVWGETFMLHATDDSMSLEVIVEDDDTTSNDFLGKVDIHLHDLIHKRKTVRWYPLTRKDGTLPAGDKRGSIQLEVQWKCDPRLATLLRKASSVDMFTKMKRGMGLEEKASDTEEDVANDNDVDVPVDTRSKEEIEKEKADKEAADAVLKSELSNIEVKSGDYTVYVHIIEARDLKAEDVSGTSDPVCFIEAFGQKFSTEVKKECLSCVWDETFVISLRNLDKDAFQEGIIRVAVMDADFSVGVVSAKNDLIGAWSVDATYVYFNQNHEMHRKWVALVDDENPEDVGSQGYLHLSIAIVGPGDKLKVHDEAEDRKAERELEAKLGGIDSLVVMPPTVQLSKQWLVTTAWKGEYLPVMDKSAIGKGGGDYYFQMEVAGGKPIKTKAQTLSGNRAQLNPTWRTELWTPVTMPCMSGNIKCTVSDFDRLGDEVVAVFPSKLKRLAGLPGQREGPRWVHMYGPPLDVPDSSAIKRLGKRAAALGKDVDWQEMYTLFPDKASTYRGRVLIEERIEVDPPAAHADDKVAFRRKVSKLNPAREPKSRPYALRAFVASGTECPRMKDLLALGTKNKKMWLKISVGKYEMSTKPKDNFAGVCEWYESLELQGDLQMPDDITQLPDVLVHLMAGDPSDALPVSFRRFKAAELVKTKFRSEPQWVVLQEDKVLDCLDDGEFPGTVLLKLGFGPLQDFMGARDEWEGIAKGLNLRQKYQLRCHIFQARDLPAADDNGLMDPFLRVSIVGQTFDTEVYQDKDKKNSLRQRETLDPMWYHTAVFDVDMVLPEYAGFFPQVCIKLYDWDLIGAPDYCGMAFVPLGDVRVEEAGSVQPPPEPEWTQFFLEVPGDGQGEILASFQLIRKDPHTQVQLPPPPDITPKDRQAWVEIIALGIRNVQPFQMLPLQLPYAQLEMDLPKGEKRQIQTNPSKKPTGANANFLERIKMQVRMPENEIFSPRLKIRILDMRLGGFSQPLVAVGHVDLAKKLPWAKDYQPPHSAIVDSAKMQRNAGVMHFGEEAQGASEAKSGEGSMLRAAQLPPPSPVSIGAAGVLPVVNHPTARQPAADAAGGVGGVVPDTGSGALGTVMGGAARPVLPERPTLSGRTGSVGDGAPGRGSFRHRGLTRRRSTFGGLLPGQAQGEEDLEDEGPPAYMKGRKVLPSELETELQTTPFETIGLFRGQRFGSMGDEYREVGKFKCIIRVTVGDPDDEPLFVSVKDFGGDLEKAKAANKDVLGQLLKPEGYRIRLYVLQAMNLTPMDMGIGGRPGKSDPFLHVKLGKQDFDGQDEYIEDVTDADLYKCIELSGELPGAGQLQINVMDYDDIGGNELIGATVIDLEDRWFDQRWQDLGKENYLCEESKDGPPVLRWNTKPLENRSLYIPTSNAPRGVLQCWVDIMPPNEASAFPPENVALPPSAKFEVRVVVWKTKDCVSMDDLTGMNDLFVKAWVEGCTPMETDTHWRAKKGKGSFNWRMKFPVELGPRARAMKFPYLTFQLWDKDILKWNDCIAEGMMDMRPYFNKAYRKNEVVTLFTTTDPKKIAQQKQLAKETEIEAQNMARDQHLHAAHASLLAGEAGPPLAQGPGDYQPPRLEETKSGPNTPGGVRTRVVPPTTSPGAGAGPSSGLPSPARTPTSMPPPQSGYTTLAGSPEQPKLQSSLRQPLVPAGQLSSSGEARKPPLAAGRSRKVPPPMKKTTQFDSLTQLFFGDEETGQKPRPAKRSPASRKPMARPMSTKQLAVENSRRKSLGLPPATKGSIQAQDEGSAEDAREFIRTLKEMTGMFEDDPPDSYWLKMERTQRATGTKEPMGQVCISIQVWPIAQADAQPAGAGRSDPNNSPFCPPPAGRLKFSMNPFAMGAELFGPQVCFYVACCCCCALTMVLLIFCQPLFNLAIALAFN